MKLALGFDYSLTMSFDYAAVVCAVLAAVVVIGFVEMQAYRKQVIDEEAERLRDFFTAMDACIEAIRAGDEPPKWELDRLSFEEKQMDSRGPTDRYRRLWRVSRWWALLCVWLVSAICLVCLWAAIDGHGPARWLAWYSWTGAATGIVTLLLGALARFRALSRPQRLHAGWDGAEYEAVRLRLAAHRQSRSAEEAP
ncbi:MULTISPECIES: hypothetical protein [unclassified Streptomyces]|uniref:hypothetical protein n=1 Tax=unclassified Streptomyces TaxID=2593676 RepID=UPI0035D58878